MRDSKAIEVSKDNKKIRRTGNAPLPTKTGTLKKREVKANEKQATKDANLANKNGEEAEPAPVERDDQGRIIF